MAPCEGTAAHTAALPAVFDRVVAENTALRRDDADPVPARAAVERHGPEVLPRLRDAYLEPWTGQGRTAAELRRAVTLAWRLSALGRACAWGRLFPGASTAAGAVRSADWLLRLFTEPPV